jgi:hypothetical protein
MSESSGSDDDERARARQRTLLARKNSSVSELNRVQVDEEDANERKLEQEQLTQQLKTREARLHAAAMQARIMAKMQGHASLIKERMLARAHQSGHAGSHQSGHAGSHPQPPRVPSAAEATRLPSIKSPSGRASGELQVAAEDPQTSRLPGATVQAAPPKSPKSPGVPERAFQKERSLPRTLSLTAEEKRELAAKEQKRQAVAAAEDETHTREAAEQARLKRETEDKERELQEKARAALEKAEAAAHARRKVEEAKAEEIRQQLEEQERESQKASAESAAKRAELEASLGAQRAAKVSLCALCARYVPLHLRPEPLQIMEWGRLPHACGTETPHVAPARCYP